MAFFYYFEKEGKNFLLQFQKNTRDVVYATVKATAVHRKLKLKRKLERFSNNLSISATYINKNRSSIIFKSGEYTAV